MNTRLAHFSIPLLRWILGLAVILESWEFIFSASAAHFLAKTGLPLGLRPALGGLELFAAVLFLVPFTIRIGGYLLLVIFGFASVIHLLHGQFRVEGLMVYMAAVVVCLSQTGERPTLEHGD